MLSKVTTMFKIFFLALPHSKLSPSTFASDFGPVDKLYDENIPYVPILELYDYIFVIFLVDPAIYSVLFTKIVAPHQKMYKMQMV